jgi:methylated-DNA-[protein]-cysteine S-methyltransferase
MKSVVAMNVSTDLGTFTVRCSERGLQEMLFGAKGAGKVSNNGANGEAGSKAAEYARQATAELKEYIAGRRTKFTVPLDLEGTEFQKKVWKALLTIPYGETRSYGEIARQVGNPKAARAVGMANHENPVAIVVPCHRVIAGDGSLGGYAGGLDRKSKLLAMERSRT